MQNLLKQIGCFYQEIGINCDTAEMSEDWAYRQVLRDLPEI